jgi:hypothetical protein
MALDPLQIVNEVSRLANSASVTNSRRLDTNAHIVAALSLLSGGAVGGGGATSGSSIDDLTPVTYSLANGVTGLVGYLDEQASPPVLYSDLLRQNAVIIGSDPTNAVAASIRAAVSATTSTATVNPLVEYKINNAGNVLFGTLNPATGQITPVGGGTAVVVGTGATQAVLQASGAAPAAQTVSPFVEYKINNAGATLFGTLNPATGQITPIGGGAVVTVGTGATQAVIQEQGDSPAPATANPLVEYKIANTGNTLFGTLDPATGQITPVGGGTAIAIGTGPTQAVLQSIAITSATQYAEGTTQATATGTAALGQRADGSLQVPRLNALDRLEVATGQIQGVAYNIVGGATGQTGYLRDDVLYPTYADAIARTNALTIGTATGNATPTGPAVVGNRDVEHPPLLKDASGTIFIAFETIDEAGTVTRGYRQFPGGGTYTPTSTPEELNDDFEVRSELWRATQAATGIVVGDLLTYYEIVNLNNALPTVVEAWYNRRTNAFLTADPIAPERADIQPNTATPIAILYDVVGGATNLRGYQVGTEVQALGWSGGARLTIGTAAGNASNLRTPAPVLLQERTIRLSAAVSEVTAFTVPAQNATVVVTATVGGANAVTAPAVANGVIGGNALDLADIQTIGRFLFAVSDNGFWVAGLYQVVSGSIATGLTIRRVDDGVMTLVQNSGQSIIAAGSPAPGPMHLAVYTRLDPLPNQTFWTVQGVSGRRVVSSAFENLSSTDAALRSNSVQDFIQLSSRNVVVSAQLGPLHSRFAIGEYLGDSDSTDILGSNLLYLQGQGDSTGEKDAFAIVSWWAGYYPGGAASA